MRSQSAPAESEDTTDVGSEALRRLRRTSEFGEVATEKDTKR